MATRRTAELRQASSAGIRLSFYDPTIRALVWQAVVLGAIALVVWYLVSNTLDNLEQRKIATGFAFLDREAGFAIGESLIPYSPVDSYFRALVVGVLNTLRVAVLGIVLATILGTLVGIARLSRNWLVAKAASVYVEAIRNVPLLVQLFFWYILISDNLPGPRQALNPLPGVFLSNRGFRFPVPVDHPVHGYMLGAAVLGVLVAVILARWARRRQERTGAQFPVIWASLAAIVGLPALVFAMAGAPIELDWPALTGFNFTGGWAVSPEFAALLIGLSIYTASFIAEVVRAGIMAVSHGQSEAAAAMGLRRGLVLRLVVLPQALRVIIPPLTNQYLNLTKNSTLAIAIGYPDLVSIANTTLNQTGQAIEGISIIMIVYLTISLSIAAFMNWYNKRIALVER